MSRATAVRPRPEQTADEWVTVGEFCAEFKISRRTFDRWRSRGESPRFEPIGGHGPLRAKRSWVDAWALGDEDGPS